MAQLREHRRSSASRSSRGSLGRGSRSWRRLSLNPTASTFFDTEGMDQDSKGSYFDIDISRLRFPLPMQTDESQCRDVYLRKLLKPFKKPIEMEHHHQIIVGVKQLRKSITLTGEGIAIFKMVGEGRRAPDRATEKTMIAFNEKMTPEQKQKYYMKLLVQTQKAAIEFLSVRMRKQLDTLIKPWPGELKEVPHKLFDWSVDCFVQRQHLNPMYLDVIQKERTKSDLDCTKFCKDVKQIIALMNKIVDDYMHDVDICKSSMDEIDKANFDLTAPWLSTGANYDDEYERLQLRNESLRDSVVAVRDVWLLAKIDTMADCLPISLRYRIGWTHSKCDQFMMKEASKEKALADELETLNDEMNKQASTSMVVDFVYQHQIDNLMAQLGLWEQRYETDTTEIEFEIEKLQSSLDKLNDQNESLKAEIEVFRQRVGEAREKEREAQENARRLLEISSISSKKRSIRKSRHSQQKKKSMDSTKIRIL